MSAVRHKNMGFHSAMSASRNKRKGYRYDDGDFGQERMGYRSVMSERTVVDVCQAEMELINKAKEEAQAKAREEERKTIAISLKEGGMSIETIAKTFKCPVGLVKKWVNT